MQPKLKAATVIDCFCGAGGLSLGFLNAGFRTVFAFDFDESCVRAYRRNLGDHVALADVRIITRES